MLHESNLVELLATFRCLIWYDSLSSWFKAKLEKELGSETDYYFPAWSEKVKMETKTFIFVVLAVL